MDIKSIRQQYPQYNDVSDGDLLMGFHKQYYPDMHVKDFMSKVDPEDNARLTITDKHWPYWEQQVSRQREGEGEYERDKRIGGDIRLSAGSDAEGMARAFGQGFSVGGFDNVVGAGAAQYHAENIDDGRSYGDLYQRYRNQEQEKIERFRDENPGMAYGSEITGAVLSPISRVLPGGKATTLRGRVAEGSMAGSVGGGIYGGLEGEDWQSAVEGAGMGAAVGGVIPMALAPLRRQRTEPVKDFAERAPSLDDLRGQANALFAQGDGAVMPRDTLRAATGSTLTNAVRQGMDMPPPGSSAQSLTPQSYRAAQRLTEESTSASPTISFRELDTLRKQAQVPAGNMGNRTEAAIGSDMVTAIDDVIDAADPELGSAIGKARELWGRMRRSEIIENAMSKAENQASGYENGIRTQFRTILNNPRLRRGFSEAQIAAMEETVRGTRVGNLLRQAGRLGPNIFGGNFANTLTPVAAGGLFGPAVPLAGGVANRLAQGNTARSAEKVRAMVASGQSPAALPQGRLSRALTERLGPTAAVTAPLAAQPVNPMQGRLTRRLARGGR